MPTWHLQIVLYEFNVDLGVVGQQLKISTIAYRLLPPGKCGILDFHLFQYVHVGLLESKGKKERGDENYLLNFKKIFL